MLRHTQHSIDAYCARENVTLAEVARRLGVTPPTVTNIRIGKFKPSLELAIKMRDLFGLATLDEVYGVQRDSETPDPAADPIEGALC